MPEVSLVAILDADKEGYLRSTGSLIQTIGRAARNVRGKAILYADKITDSMRRALDETERRRTRQIEYNRAHNITPKTIVKRITDVMEGARDEPANDGASKPRRGKRGLEAIATAAVAEPRVDYASMSPETLGARLKKLEDQMFKHAQNLEFESAARLRDEIKRIKAQGLMA
jgi:excinuclease ABC subunit B